MRGRLVALASLVAGSLGAQPAPTPGPHAGHAAHGAGGGPVSAAARAQLDEARRATAHLATPEAAIAAGYRPMFGNAPLQGEHYVRFDLVFNGDFDVERPSVLMFAPVNGKATLVGAAYAFLHPTDSAPPAGFDGVADEWHAHERLTRTPGKHLVMTHAWFVDAPEGPFARYNPWLPYLAAGVTPPSAAELARPESGERARRLGLALALARTPPLLFQMLDRQRGDSLRTRTAPHRAALEAAVSRLVAAERVGDAAERGRAAAEAAMRADSLVAAYREAAPDRPLVGRLVDRTVDEFMGRGHGVEEELDALFERRAGRRAP
ncbi:MAG: hypothetical protein ACJ8AO_17835 [Gemmatimonadaceae bacterium]